eukprot:4982629-Pyramimonas_sp.AAC.1
MPHCSLSRQAFFSLESWGGPRLRSALVLNLATLIRASISTFSVWRSCVARLSEAGSELSLEDVSRGRRCPEFWTDPPICDTLHAAST